MRRYFYRYCHHLHPLTRSLLRPCMPLFSILVEEERLESGGLMTLPRERQATTSTGGAKKSPPLFYQHETIPRDN
jgi:hypothetical protein